MYPRIFWLVLSLLSCFSTRSLRAAEEVKPIPSVSGSWLEVDIGIIGAASADILATAMSEVKDNNYAGLIIVLDTPGGALEATRSMVKDILAAPFPVIVWVGPSGAHAGSAGAFITLAAHLATMAPGTNIGAAHPVQGLGQDLEEGSDMRAKVENDTLAFMESIARLRGRNVEIAQSFVATSLSITAEEALENKVIDFLARDLTQALKAADGRIVTLGEEQKVQLKTADAPRVKFEKSLRQKFLEILSNPNLFYLLFIAGLLGIGFELTHPGTLVPGVIGAISLILALISSAVLPVNFGAMTLIVASVAFMIAEVFLPSFGILGIGGFIGFIVGSVLLVDSRNELGLAISWLSIIPSALVIAGFTFLVSYLVVRNQRSKVQSGSEALLGMEAEALAEFVQGRGQVRLQGEIWSADIEGEEPVQIGDKLEVLAIHGLILRVRKSSSTLRKG
jgi:membrane-bound serine protease (ClpP class)